MMMDISPSAAGDDKLMCYSNSGRMMKRRRPAAEFLVVDSSSGSEADNSSELLQLSTHVPSNNHIYDSNNSNSNTSAVLYQPDERVFKRLRIDDRHTMEQQRQPVDYEHDHHKRASSQYLDLDPNGKYNYNPINQLLGSLHSESRQRQRRRDTDVNVNINVKQPPQFVYLHGHRYAYGPP